MKNILHLGILDASYEAIKIVIWRKIPQTHDWLSYLKSYLIHKMFECELYSKGLFDEI
jgi:hypothetical protein